MKSLDAIGRGYLGLSARCLGLLMASAFLGTATVHAQGVGTGTAAVNIGNALGTPGGTASVTVSLATQNQEAAAAQIDVMFDPQILSLTAEDCVQDPRLTAQTLNVFLLGDPADTVRIAVSDQSPPIAQLTAGALATCAFRVAGNAAFGDTDLVADNVVVGSRSGQRICGPGTTACDSTDGVVSIGQATATPTATSTPTRQASATNTPPATATSTREATATVTPTGGEATPTDTPEGGTPTNTPEATETFTRPPTATNTPEPTSTEVQQGTPTATRTNTPGAKGNEDDSCAIVPASQVNPLHSLLLLAVPALLLWGRRRRL